jgi:hypothetical protein
MEREEEEWVNVDLKTKSLCLNWQEL